MDFLDLLGVPYHAPGVFFLGTDFLFKSILAFCEIFAQTLGVIHKQRFWYSPL